MKIICKSYIWKSIENPEKLNVKFVCGSEKEHSDFCDFILADPSIESCIEEYIHEIDLSRYGTSYVVKKKESVPEIVVQNDREDPNDILLE